MTTHTFTAHRGNQTVILACNARDVFYARYLLRDYLWSHDDLEGYPTLENIVAINSPPLATAEMESKGWEPVLVAPSGWWLWCGGSNNPVVGNGELSEFGICKGCRWWWQWMAMKEIAKQGDIPNCHPCKRESD